MTEDRTAEYQQRIQDLEDSLLRQDQLYFDKLNQFAKDLESSLEKVIQYSKELCVTNQMNQSLESEIRQMDADIQSLNEQIRLRDEKIGELHQLLDVNHLSIQQAQEELELCHIQYLKNRDEHAKSIKKQMILLGNTLTNRLRGSIANLLPYRVLRRGKRIVERMNS